MNNYKDYLSEFESEFELDDSVSEYNADSNASSEFESELENDFSGESEYEFESGDESEIDEEGESDEEYEFESLQDSESENYLQEYGSPDQEFEDRLYAALSGQYETSYEMEQEIDRVLYEIEDHFFKLPKIKRFFNKHKKKLLSVAKSFVPGGTIRQLAKFAGGDLRNLLKSDLFKKGLSMAANAVAPGVGGALAGGLLNSEMPNANRARAQAKQAVKVARDAYRNLAGTIPNLRPGNVPNQIHRLSRQALIAAHSRNSVYKGKSRKVIPRSPNSIVVVRPDRIIIYS